MYAGRTLFSQVMDFVPWTSFDRIVRKYGGDVRVRTLRCTEHFRVMAFAQVTYRESLRGNIPSFIHVSDGKMGDAPALDLIAPEAGAIYVMDRGYVDFRRLYVIHQAGAFFVTRTKVNMKYHRVYSHPVPDKTTGVGSDQSIALDGFYAKQDYPQHLRRVSFCDPETAKRLVFLTNNFTLSAAMIAALYKKRWAVELFFKWIKQNLRIKHFYGT